MGENAGGVTGRPRRGTDYSSSSTVSLARGDAALFPRARAPVHILPRRWCLLAGATRAGKGAPSTHQDSFRWQHQPPPGLPAHSWDPARPALAVRRLLSLGISSAPRLAHLLPQA